jgi:hypothetical protein
VIDVGLDSVKKALVRCGAIALELMVTIGGPSGRGRRDSVPSKSPGVTSYQERDSKYSNSWRSVKARIVTKEFVSVSFSSGETFESVVFGMDELHLLEGALAVAASYFDGQGPFVEPPDGGELCVDRTSSSYKKVKVSASSGRSLGMVPYVDDSGQRAAYLFVNGKETGQAVTEGFVRAALRAVRVTDFATAGVVMMLAAADHGVSPEDRPLGGGRREFDRKEDK